MNKPSIYDICRREVDPMSDTLKAVVELNWHVHRAEQAGWTVELEVHEGENTVRVNIMRGESWPTEESEAEAAEAGA